MEHLHLEVAKLIGEPINTQLPVPVELGSIADVFTVEPGEHTWRYQNLDETADVILDVDTDGVITVKKRTPLNDVELTFKGLNSKLEYVLVEDILNKVDTNALARRKQSITRGMDKKEIKLILDAILTPSSTYFPANEVGGTEVTVASGDDLFDVIMALKHAVEDYGDNYMLLVGKSVKEAIDTYEKDNATSFNYNISLTAKLRELGVDVMKIFGKVSVATNEAETDLLDANTMILIARNSRIAEGKPIKFVRRRISREIAAQMGADVDTMERATIVNPVPVQDTISGSRQSVLAYGVYGYESVIFCITNPKAIAWADCDAIL